MDTKTQITRYELEEQFKNMLDECYEPIQLLGSEYPVSQVLRETDPIAYRCALAEYEDYAVSEQDYEILD
jgi:hypothetical protein